MDAADVNNASRNALRQPFIDTANALASLYKRAVAAERDARDAGSRAAYMQIMQWAAHKSHSSESVSASDVINFCAAELAQIPQQQPHPPLLPPSQSPASPSHDPQPPNQQQQQQSLTHQPKADSDSDPAPVVSSQQQTHSVAYVPRDDLLISDIKRLHVNPRKRQRIDISDTFISACRDTNTDALIFSAPEHGYLIRSPESSPNPVLFSTNSPLRQGNSVPPRRDGRESRESPFSSVVSSEYPARRGKNSKNHIYDKHKRK